MIVSRVRKENDVKICPDCGYFSEEKYDEYSPYPGECEDCYRYEICLEAERKESKMTTKELGKITFAEFGTIRDYPFLIGLQIGFRMGGSAVMDGGKYTVNISPECKWKELNRETTITKSIEEVNRILEDAKVNYVSELLNKPVEVTMENNTFKDFRILTEVL